MHQLKEKIYEALDKRQSSMSQSTIDKNINVYKKLIIETASDVYSENPKLRIQAMINQWMYDYFVNLNKSRNAKTVDLYQEKLSNKKLN